VLYDARLQPEIVKAASVHSLATLQRSLQAAVKGLTLCSRFAAADKFGARVNAGDDDA